MRERSVTRARILHCRSRLSISATRKIVPAFIKPYESLLDPYSQTLITARVSGSGTSRVTRWEEWAQVYKVTRSRRKPSRDKSSTQRERKRDSESQTAFYKGRQNVRYEGISSFDPSPWVKEARTLALATIWAFLPLPKLRSGPKWAPTIRPENPPPNTHGWWGYNGCARRSDVHEVYTYGTQKRYAGWWRGRFLLPTYCWLGGDCSLSHVPSHCSLWRTRREKKKKRSRTGRVPHHSGTSTRCRGRHCSSRLSHVGVARSPFHSTRPMVVSQHWSSQAWRHRALPALEKLPCVHHRFRFPLIAFNSSCYILLAD